MKTQIETPQQNWTKYPNCILDNLDKFTPAELKVISLMIRKNIGYDKPNKKFSLTYICMKTGLTKPTVNKAVRGLIEKQSIHIVGKAERGLHLYDILWQKPTVKNFNRLKNLTTTGKEIKPDPVKKFNPLQENKVLDTKVKENTNVKRRSVPANDLKYSKRVKLIMDFKKRYYHLYGEDLYINSKEIGQIGLLLKKNESAVSTKMERLYEMCQESKNDFWKFTPSMLNSQWNKLTAKNVEKDPSSIYPRL